MVSENLPVIKEQSQGAIGSQKNPKSKRGTMTIDVVSSKSFMQKMKIDVVSSSISDLKSTRHKESSPYLVPVPPINMTPVA